MGGFPKTPCTIEFVHEAYLHIGSVHEHDEREATFFAYAARHILVDAARRCVKPKRGSDTRPASISRMQGRPCACESSSGSGIGRRAPVARTTRRPCGESSRASLLRWSRSETGCRHSRSCAADDTVEIPVAGMEVVESNTPRRATWVGIWLLPTSM